MKIRGTTITTPIARHAVADDSVVSRKPWSSKNVVDNFGIVAQATGTTISLKDSSALPLQGLKIYGTEETASAESVTVNVYGKNLADVRKFSTNSTIATPTASISMSNTYGTSIEVNGKSVVVTQSKCGAPTDPTAFWNGFFTVGFYCPLRVGDIIRASFKFEITDNPLNDARMTAYITDKQAKAMSFTNETYSITYTINEDTKSVNGWNYMTFRNGGKSGIFSNFQIEYGSTYTGYEEYKELQTITIPTPNGLQSGEVLEVEDANTLHTHKPCTNITNDCGAEMSVEYVADTKAYIDNKFTELQNAILASGANV